MDAANPAATPVTDSPALPRYNVARPIDESRLAPRRPRLRVLSVCSVALSINIAVAVLLLLPEQSHEALRVLAEDKGGDTYRLFLMWIAAAVLALLSWWSCRATLANLHPQARREEWGAPNLAVWLPRLIGCAPFVAVGLAIAVTETAAGGTARLTAPVVAAPLLLWFVLREWSSKKYRFYIMAAAGLVLAVGLAAIQFQRDQTALTPMLGLCIFSAPAFVIWTMQRTRARGHRSADPPMGARAVALAVILPVLVSLVLVVVLTAWPDLAAYAGPGTIVLTAAAIWLPPLSVLHWVSLRWGFPVLLAVVVLGLGASALDLNDNHAVRSLPRAAPAAAPGFEEAFRAWIADRAKGTPEGEPVPVFLVAAEGGGIYAAYHTARALALLQDQNDLFADQVFAISGVSGGSVGAAVFCALVEHGRRHWPTGPAPFDWYAGATDRVLSRDFLSPLVGSALMEDLLQRLVPWPMPVFDRARALERSFERAWRHAMRRDGDGAPDPAFRDTFAMPFDDLWAAGGSGRRVPSLLLNTTEVETGRRLIVSNLDLPHDLFPNVATLRGLAPEVNPPLSTAACLSARFPLVTPAAWIRLSDEALGRDAEDFSSAERDAADADADADEGERGGAAGDGGKRKLGPRKRRLVDGGYFENTGLATLLDVRDAIAAIYDDDRLANPPGERLPPCRIVLIRIGSVDGRGGGTFQGLGEVLSPVRATLNTRGARGRDAIRQLRRLTVKLNTDQEGAAERRPERLEFVLDTHKAYPVPLGWLLSSTARRAIADQVPTTRDLAVASAPPEVGRIHAQAVQALQADLTAQRALPKDINAETVKGVEQLLMPVRSRPER